MLLSTKMRTGFNTDVQHEGHVYHVQTEDCGVDNPAFESLVYVGGTIVAKKRTTYNEQLNTGATNGKDAITRVDGACETDRFGCLESGSITN